MIYCTPPCGSEDVMDAQLRGELGYITTPRQANVKFPAEVYTVADCGAFSGNFDPTKWWAWLVDQPRTMAWAVCPDVYDPDGGECHGATLEKWHYWSGKMQRVGFTPAFVCQVGSAPDNIPEEARVLFLGGTTEWKEGKSHDGVAADIVKYGNDTGRWVHMGRVNTERRLLIARTMGRPGMGCDSADGTYLTYGPDKNLPRLLRFLRQSEVKAEAMEHQPQLWEA